LARLSGSTMKYSILISKKKTKKYFSTVWNVYDEIEKLFVKYDTYVLFMESGWPKWLEFSLSVYAWSVKSNISSPAKRKSAKHGDKVSSLGC